jgi:hypothetical protein
MAKPIVKDGKTYRMRRGKLVEIPPEWVGKTVSAATKQRRPSHHIHKLRKPVKTGQWKSHESKTARAAAREIADELNSKK